MGRLLWTPFLDGNDRLSALILCWLVHFPAGCDFGLAACQKQLSCFCEVLTDMEAICDLKSLWSSLSRSRSILSAAISTHDGDLWVVSHPSGCGFGLPIRQHINGTVTLQIDKDRAEAVTTPEGSGKGMALPPSLP
jgi:hypothetical protein